MHVLALGILASVMVLVGAYVIRLSARARSSFDRALAIFLVAMMTSMTSGLLLYELFPPLWGIEIALWVSMWVMVIGIGWLITKLLEPGYGVPVRSKHPILFRTAVIAGAFGTEGLLGMALGLASGQLSPLLHYPLLTAVAALLSSAWFLFPMAAEMGLSLLLLREKLTRFVGGMLALQPFIMAFSPTAIGTGVWVYFAVAAGSTLMTVFMIVVMDHLARRRAVGTHAWSYMVRVTLVYALMMAGLFLWEYSANELLFAASVILEMALFFDAILETGRFEGAEAVEWTRNPTRVFGIVFAVFVAEFFMGGLLDIAFFPGFLTRVIPQMPAATTPFLWAQVTFMIGLFFVTGVLGSAGFLLMMGAEMGALVVFKMLGTRSRETRIRLMLVIGAFFVYTLYLPSFFFPMATLPLVPMVGWSMGIGTSGGVVPLLLLAILATYAISGLLSLLFGARQMCSGLCSAALMYQGTFYDSLKTFNRSSAGGRRLLGSKISRLYGLIFSISWGSITAAALISYLNNTGTINLSVYGTDVAHFAYILYFNLLWYVVFVSIPFVGTYACVSSGFCYWGTFNQMLGRLGFFKLKVRDAHTCVTCPDKPCTRACPVGLTELPRDFMQKGEFRALKCIGVGDCAESCPYDNIVFWDVRHYLKLKLSPHSTDNNIGSFPNPMTSLRPGAAKDTVPFRMVNRSR